MKAAFYRRYGPPAVIEIGALPDPAPRAGEVLVAVEAASVGQGDCKLRAGLLRAHFDLAFPKVPGRDGAGRIAALGPDATGWPVGTRVAFLTPHRAQGGAAERIACPIERIARIPDRLDATAAAALAQAGMSAWISLVETAAIGPGTRLLVQGGSGSIGTLAVQIARRRGAEVWATCRAAHRDFVRGLGADRALAYDDPRDTPPARHFDVVFDLIGGAVAEASYPLLKPGGTLLHLTALPFRDRSAEFGVTTRHPAIHERGATLQAILDEAAAGGLTPQIAAVLPLDDCAEAHRRLEAGEIKRGRLVLRVS